jgi:hypothetical protein
MSNSIFANNSATIGGALHSTDYGSFFGCLFVGNSADNASVTLSPWQVLTNCTLIQEGGSTPAVVSEYGTGFTNCVLVRGGSGPIAAITPGYDDAVLGMVSSLIDDDNQAFEVGDGTLFWEGSTVAPPTFLDPLGSDGLASTWEDNDYRPGPGSLAIDAGRSDRTIHCRQNETDPTGNPRIVDAWNYQDAGVPCGYNNWTIDIGAFEAPADTLRPCPADWNIDGFLDINDVIAFLGDFDAENLGADLNADGIWDLYDLQQFLGLYAVGCAVR